MYFSEVNSVGKIRVLVANRPRLMREFLLATISDQLDMEVAAEVANDSDVLRTAAESQPDFIIISAEKAYERPPVCADLLAQNPQAKILVLAPELQRGAFSWAVIDNRSMHVETSDQGISEQGVLDTIRDSVRSAAGAVVVH